jgi:hypothetical protein
MNKRRCDVEPVDFLRKGFVKYLVFLCSGRSRNDQRLKVWLRPERFRGCVATSRRSESHTD